MTAGKGAFIMRRRWTPDLLPWQAFTGMGTDCTSLCQDREGAIWCGSASGVCRFDGKRARHMGSAQGLPPGHVTHLATDGADRVWLAAAGRDRGRVGDSLAVIEGDRVRTFGKTDGWPGWRVTGMALQRGTMWIAADGGIAAARDWHFHLHTSANGLVSHRINCVVARRDGSIWAGTDFGLVAIDDNGMQHMTAADGLPSGPVQALAEDRMGRLWIAMPGGLACRDGSGFKFWTARDGLTTIPAHTVCVDRADRVWTGSNAGQGACCFDGGSFTPVSTSTGMPHNSVAMIASDREGGLFFAMHHAGVARLDLTGFMRISDDPVPDAACLSREGALWWATGDCIVRLDGHGTHTAFRVADHVTALHADRHRRLWIGTVSSLAVADASRTSGRPLHVPVGAGATAAISSLCEDASGTVWITARGQGAFIYDDTEEVAVHVAPQLDGAPFSGIMIDSRGRLWTFDWRRGANGVWSQDGASRKHFSTDDGLPDNRVSCMFEDQSGQVWAGTLDGVALLDGHKFVHLAPAGGLAGRAVQCIMQDSRGHVWIGFLGGGITRYDGRNFQTLSMVDGLPSDRVTGIFEDQDRTIVVTTYKGVCRYTPEDGEPPGIRIEAVETDRVHAPGDAVSMSSSIPAVRIRFHGTSLKTRRMQYTYMLDGFDTEWRATSRDEVRYEALPPGMFTFRVMAMNRDLVYSGSPAEVRIEVVRDPLEQRLNELEREVRNLEGLLQVCSVCKRIMNDRKEWEQLEVYVSRRSRADFSHGYCPACAAKAMSAIQEGQGAE
jgi:ligand-binding sensor domain-containing protein